MEVFTNSEIVVVDDVPANLQLFREIMAHSPYVMRAYRCPIKALEGIQKDPPDIILLDIEMPEMNGIELAESLKEHPQTKEIPIIFISGNQSKSSIVEGLEAGAVDYITKPFNVREILVRIRNHLELHLHRKSLKSFNISLEDLVQDSTEKLQELQNKLTLTNKLKANLLSMISHEIRTPINGILGITNMIMDDHEIEEGLTSDFFDCQTRLQRLLDDITLIQNMAQLKEQEKEGFDAIEVLEELIGNSRVSIEINWDTSNETNPFLIKADRELMKEIFLRIIHLSERLNEGGFEIYLSGKDVGFQINFKLKNSNLKPEYRNDFFELESLGRSYSKAEELGISPVIVSQLLKLFQGNIFLSNDSSKGDEIVVQF